MACWQWSLVVSGNATFVDPIKFTSLFSYGDIIVTQIPFQCYPLTYLIYCLQEQFEDTKGVIRIRNPLKERQYNGERKNTPTNNDLQNTTQKTKDSETHTSDAQDE